MVAKSESRPTFMLAGSKQRELFAVVLCAPGMSSLVLWSLPEFAEIKTRRVCIAGWTPAKFDRR